MKSIGEGLEQAFNSLSAEASIASRRRAPLPDATTTAASAGTSARIERLLTDAGPARSTVVTRWTG